MLYKHVFTKNVRLELTIDNFVTIDSLNSAGSEQTADFVY